MRSVRVLPILGIAEGIQGTESNGILEIAQEIRKDDENSLRGFIRTQTRRCQLHCLYKAG